MDLNIDELINRPGHFVVQPGKEYKIAGGSEGKKLDTFKEPAAAKSAYQAYAHCRNNAVALIEDADLLFEAGRFPAPAPSRSSHGKNWENLKSRPTIIRAC